MTKPQIAFLGTGLMGGPMAANLLKAGFPVTAWNRTPAKAEALAPAGAHGPAFMVGPNFRTILRYNNATSYALAVGTLARRVAGEPGISADWPRQETLLSRSQVRELQRALNARGFATGTPDGIMGPNTRAGLRAYQAAQGLTPDGFATVSLLERLQQ